MSTSELIDAGSRKNIPTNLFDFESSLDARLPDDQGFCSGWIQQNPGGYMLVPKISSKKSYSKGFLSLPNHLQGNSREPHSQNAEKMNFLLNAKSPQQQTGEMLEKLRTFRSSASNPFKFSQRSTIKFDSVKAESPSVPALQSTSIGFTKSQSFLGKALNQAGALVHKPKKEISVVFAQDLSTKRQTQIEGQLKSKRSFESGALNIKNSSSGKSVRIVSKSPKHPPLLNSISSAALHPPLVHSKSSDGLIHSPPWMAVSSGLSFEKSRSHVKNMMKGLFKREKSFKLKRKAGIKLASPFRAKH